ncbi:Unknown protein sequence [Pseudomonas syringae pv. spinaceae]|uniref:Uncharacterized protein n=1 Tax=Pseudomonas syringae pv. spinaceae TaxID=264459 RepID=A0A0P9ZXN0_PSESX|nr:Unknown protein sequence [Pseudomonas syringae pv. spinaceae]
MRPDLQRRTQRFAQLGASVQHAALRVFINAVVMHHVAAGAQHAEKPVANRLGVECFGDQVVPGRARRSDNRAIKRKRALVLQVDRQADQRCREGLDAGNRLIAVNDALVTFDSGQRQRRLRLNGIRQGQHLGFAAAAAAPTWHAVFDHHVQAQPVRRKKLAQRRDVVGVIDHAVEFKHRIGQQTGDHRHVGRTHQLVGHQYALHTVGVRGLSLDGRRQRHAPGTRVQLATKQRGDHAGLAMRRQLGAAVGDKLLHPANVVLQRLIVDDQCGQTDITEQTVTRLSSPFFHNRDVHNSGVHDDGAHSVAPCSYSLIRRARPLALSISTRR